MRVERDLNEGVAAILRARRVEAGLTIEQLAERADIPVVTVQRLLRAKRVINVLTLTALCEAMDVSPGEVLTLGIARVGQPDPDLVQRVLAGARGTRVTPRIERR